MIFSYFFDPEKKNKLEFIFQVLNYTVKNNATIEILFNAKIQEVHDGLVTRSEYKLGTFTFDAGSEDQQNASHDIDFHRIRFGPQKKWIFEIKNNRKPEQNIFVGLITSTSSMNPIGMDIIQESSIYDAKLKGNNLATLEASYTPPEVDQTLVLTSFNTAEYPVGFESNTATFIPDKMMYSVSDFKQSFVEEVPAYTKFYLEMNLAPADLSSVVDKVFDFNIDGVGVISLTKTHLHFLKQGDQSSKQVALVSAVAPEIFYKDGMFLQPSRFFVQTDGVGNITINYAGVELKAFYNRANPISFVEYSTVPVMSYIDNLNIKFTK